MCQTQSAFHALLQLVFNESESLRVGISKGPADVKCSVTLGMGMCSLVSQLLPAIVIV